MALRDTAYIVLGASGGIGSEVVRQILAAGGQVLLAGRNETALGELAAATGQPARVVDAAEIPIVESLAEIALDEFGRVDGVVNCVGSLMLKPAHLTSPDDWQATLNANLTSAFAAVRLAAKAMRKPGPAGVSGGSVVLFSSAAGRTGLANHEAIAAAKAGVIGLAQSAAATYARAGIRFNAIAPGLVKTPLTEKIWSNDKSAAASTELHAVGRLGEPADIARMVAWLLDPDNSWITGEVFGLDGGLAKVRPPASRG